MRRRRFLQSLLGVLAAVYVPNWKPERVYGPRLDLEITEVDGSIIDVAAFIDGRPFEVAEVARWFNVPPDVLGAFPDHGLIYKAPDRLP